MGAGAWCLLLLWLPKHLPLLCSPWMHEHALHMDIRTDARPVLLLHFSFLLWNLEMIPNSWEGSSVDLQGNSVPDLDVVANWTSKHQVNRSKNKQHLKACDRNKKEHIYLNVKDCTSSKKKMMRRQRKEHTESKDSPVSCATHWIIAMILGILFLALLGTAVGLIKDCPCPRCPEQWVAYRECCYFFSRERKDWHSSRESCRAQGAHLLVINSTSEMDFFQIVYSKSYWIGLKNNTGGGWIWEDGSKLTDTKFSQVDLSMYPRDSNTQTDTHVKDSDTDCHRVLFNSFVQNCATLEDGLIRASSCEIPAPWICEKSLQ